MDAQPHTSLTGAAPSADGRPPLLTRAVDPQRLAAALCCALGYGLNSVWCILIGHTPTFMASIAASGVSANPRLFYLAGILVFALVCTVWPGQLRRADRALRFALPIAGVVGGTCFVLPANGLALPFVPWGPLGLFATGIVFLWIAARYVLVLALARGVRAVIGCVAGGIVVKVALVEAINGIGSFAVSMACAAASLLGACLLFEVACRLLRREGVPGALPGRTVFGVPRLVPPHRCAQRSERLSAYLLVVIAAVTLAVVRCISYLGLWGEASTAISQSSPWLLGVVVPSLLVIAFAHFALGRLQGLPLSTRFLPALFITLAGLFAAVIRTNPSSAELTVLGSVVQVCELFAHLLLWTVTATALEALELPAYRTVGLAWGTYALVSLVWVATLTEAPPTVTLVAMFVLYLVLIALLYAVGHLSAQPEAASGAPLDAREPDGDAAAPSILDRCALMAEEHRLSPRETEVFMLLVQGRSHSFIQDELGLSGSTVKTHVAHIYTKMGVQGRQELLDMVWDGEPAGARPA